MSETETAKNQEELFDKEKLKEIIGLDIDSLPLEPKEHRSAGIIGTAGHVDHGKSTLTQALTGKFPATYSEELIRGITIKLGYSHLDILLCPDSGFPEAFTSNARAKCPTKERPRHLRCYSILDHPGHEILISTMLSGASITDYALVVIAANEPCPMPQTREHVAALEVMGVKNIIVAQNKIELVSKERAFENYKEILNFFENETSFGTPIIIPVSAALGINIDILLATIYKKFTPLEKKLNADPIMYVARTFDPNLPGTKPEKLIGGAFGGALKQGTLKVGEEIEIRPGIIDKKGNAQPILSEIASIQTDGGHPLEEAQPHALIGIATFLDPGLTKADKLAGSIIGKPGRLPEIVRSIYLRDLHMFPRIIGAKINMENAPLKKNERILINVGTNINFGLVQDVDDDSANIILAKPISIQKGEIVAISRLIEREFRLVGYGSLDY
ncbi:MAG: translation initiation factor IF-2 subunit gamma [Candidatus Njordarchaeum guaymaensis]